MQNGGYGFPRRPLLGNRVNKGQQKLLLLARANCLSVSSSATYLPEAYAHVESEIPLIKLSGS
jgi:hypothetical protein